MGKILQACLYYRSGVLAPVVAGIFFRMQESALIRLLQMSFVHLPGKQQTCTIFMSVIWELDTNAETCTGINLLYLFCIKL